jgi:hypothetical protein
MSTYRWKPGVVAKVDPQVAGDELERIRIRHNGMLEPEYVLTAARDPDAPLHKAFEWNDERAAEAYRVDQARYLIRSIEVFVDRPDQEPSAVRAFVNIERDNERTYTSTVDALSDPDLRRQVIASAWKELESWRNRHAELIEFGKIFAEIDQARGSE